jgi:general secretion pathway protein N
MTRTFHRVAAAVLFLGGTLLAGPAAAQAPVAPGQQSFELPPLDQLRATRERPLFVPTRRRPDIKVEAAAPAPVVEDKSLPFQLTGIVLGQDVRVAILRQNGQPEELRLRANEKVADWTLEEIGDRYVILGGRGKRVRLWLFDDTDKAGITVNDANAPAPYSGPAKRDDVDLDVVPGEKPPPPAVPPARLAPRSPATGNPPAMRPRPN